MAYRWAFALLLAILFLFALPVSAGTLYFNDTIASCPDTYDPADSPPDCTGGSAKSVATWAEVETWLSGDAGPSVIYVVGSNDVNNPYLVQLEDVNAYSLNLSGNQCSAGVTITADPNFSYHRITSREDASGWAWEIAYPASQDRALLHGNVWRAPQPLDYEPGGKRSNLWEDGTDSIARMVAAYEDGSLREWDPLTGTRWRFVMGNSMDFARPDIPVDTVYRYGDFYASGGWIYKLFSDGGAPTLFENGETRTPYWTRAGRRLIATTDCTDVVLDGLYIDGMDRPIASKGDVRPVLRNSTIGRLFIGYGYYTLGYNQSATKRGSDILIEDNYFVLAPGMLSNHRGNTVLTGNVDGVYTGGNVYLMGGGHGDHTSTNSTSVTSVNDVYWGPSGKSIENSRVDPQQRLYSVFSFMQQTFCNEKNVPAGSPLGTENECPPELNSSGLDETENHYFVHIAGRDGGIDLNPQYSGRSGGTTVTAFLNYGHGDTLNFRSVNAMYYNLLRGDFINPAGTSNNSQGDNSVAGFNFADFRETTQGPKSGYVINSAFINVANTSEALGEQPYAIGVSFNPTYGGTMASRDLHFYNSLITSEITGAQAGRQGKLVTSTFKACDDGTANDLESNSGTTGMVCADTNPEVRAWYAPDAVNNDLRPLDNTSPALDAGKTVATAVDTESSSTTLDVTDVYAFPRPNIVSANAQASFARHQNERMCGEATCDNAGNPGFVPDAFWIADPGVPSGSAFVQIGASTRTTYSGWAHTGPGNQGILTLDSAASWSSGDGVHPLPWTGVAPDIGNEYFEVVDQIIATDDTFNNVPISDTTTLTVCTNDSGNGGGASGYNIKTGTVVENPAGPLITNLAITAGTCTGVDVTTSATPGVAYFDYQLEKVSETLESNVATVTVNIVDPSGTADERIYTQLDVPVDIQQGAEGAWVDTDLMTLAGVPDDASGVYIETIANSGSQYSVGFRFEGDTDVPYGDAVANARSTVIEPTQFGATGTGGADIEQQHEAAFVSLNVYGYFANSSLLTWHEGTTVALTCDGTWHQITETGNVFAAYRIPAAEMGGALKIAYDNTGKVIDSSALHNQYIWMAVNGSGEIEYQCPTSGGVDSLERVLTSTGSFTGPTSGDFETFTVAETQTKEWITPTDFACPSPGCYAYVVAIDGNSGNRYGIATEEAYAAANDVGNSDDRYEIVKADDQGRMSIISNNANNVDFHIVGAFNSGDSPVTIPTILEISTCPGTADLHDRAPDISSHGGTILASNTTVQCDSDDIDLPAAQAFAVPVGTANYTIDIKFEEVSGTTQFEFSHDCSHCYDYVGTPYSNDAGLKANLGWGGGVYRLNSNTPGQVNLGEAVLPGLIAAEGDAYVRIVSSSNSPWTQQTMDLYVSPVAITSQDVPKVSAVYSGSVRADNGVIQIRQQGSDLEVASLTVTSSSQVDTLAPTAPTITPVVDGQQVSLPWTPPADNGGAVASYLKRVYVLRDTTPTPTTYITTEPLDPATVLYQEVAPGVGLYYYAVVFCDASNNCAQTADISVTTGTPNTAPTVSDGATTVPVGVDYPSDTVVLDIESICSASDADGDPIYVDAIGTQPTNGVVTTRVDSELVDYQHAAGFPAADSFVVTVKDDNGAVSGNCTVTVTPQTPPYIEVSLPLDGVDMDGVDVKWRLRIWDITQDDPEVGPGFDLVSILEGTSPTTDVACPQFAIDAGHSNNCGGLGPIYLEQDRARNDILNLPPVGTIITMTGEVPSITNAAGIPFSFSTGVAIQQ